MDTAPALVVTRAGGPDVFEVQEVPVAAPGPGELLVRVAAAGVNFIDVYRREGIYPMQTPYTSGLEGAGTVVTVGPGVTTHVGARVAWADAPGSSAGLAIVRDAVAVPVPDEVDLETAAALMLQGLTAHYLAASTFPIRDGHLALVHAAAGGVGQLLIQLVVHRGGRVVASASNEDKLALARDLGAEITVSSSDPASLAERVREATDGGVHVVYDGVGAATFDASLASLRPRGTCVLYGAASGPVPPLDPQRLNSGGSLFLTRPKLGDYTADREELVWRTGELFALIADGTLRPPATTTYALSDAVSAYADLEGRRSTGKLLLIP